MSKKIIPNGELLRLACVYAEQDRESFIDALERCKNDPLFKETYEEAVAYLAQLRAYRVKRWGKTRQEVEFEGLKSVPVEEVIKQSS